MYEIATIGTLFDNPAGGPMPPLDPGWLNPPGVPPSPWGRGDQNELLWQKYGRILGAVGVAAVVGAGVWYVRRRR